jgi:murein DD-endopeptidase MepM/ murein hydrolase activator NlpD
VTDEELEGPHHEPPPPGEPQPLSAGSGGAVRGVPQGNFVNVNGRLFAPLQGLNPDNVLQGGYGWLSVTDGGATYHPGLDLNSGGSCNADEGLYVVAPLAGVVRATLYWNGYTPGEGNHVWVELDDPCLPGPTWWHTDHLQSISVGIGQRLGPGDPIGLCGRTGGWDCAHAHTELLKGPPANGWYQWPKWWSVAQVEAAYWDPTDWWNAATALVLAEGHQPIPPEVVMAMSDWELTNYVLATLYEWAGIPFNPDGGMAKTWVAAMRAGHYPGRPRTDDRRYGEGEGDGWWAEFESGLLVYKRDGTMSWTG